VPTVIQTDNVLKAVITNIQSTNTALSTATTTSVEIQTISVNITKYTVVLEVNGEKTQAVYLTNPTTI
jgi:hypothetical protein